MAYPSVALPVAVIGGDHSAAVQNNVYAIINALRNPPEAIGRKTAAQSPANATWVGLDMDAEDFDNGALWDGAMHDSATNNSRITITTAGRYEIWGGVSWQNNGAGRRLVQIRKNSNWNVAGGTEMAYWTFQTVSSGTSHASIPKGFLIVPCVAGDYFELFHYQDSGGALALDASGDKGGNILGARMVGS